MNGPELEYHFKCEKCGTDLGEGKSDAQGIKSVKVANGNTQDATPAFTEIPIPQLKIECTLEFLDGSQIPLHPVSDDRKEVTESFTVFGHCPTCGTAFVRQIRHRQ